MVFNSEGNDDKILPKYSSQKASIFLFFNVGIFYVVNHKCQGAFIFYNLILIILG